MKELSIEEKVKAYDEVLERAKNFIEHGDERERTIAESIFAGLIEESEDERIRKWIRKELESKYVVDNIVNNEMADKALAWLEKKGEKERIADLAILFPSLTDFEKRVSHIFVSILNGDYEYDVASIKEIAKIIEKQDEHKHEWTPMDEQRVENLLAIIEGHGYPGEVKWLNSLKDRVQSKQGKQKLAKVKPKFKIGQTIIYKGTENIAPTKMTISNIAKGQYWDDNCCIVPISDQDNWKLVEQNPTEDSCKNSDDITTEEKDRIEYKKGFECGKQRVLKYPEDFGLCKKTDWNKEDERCLINAIIACEQICDEDYDYSQSFIDAIKWLKSIKDRVQPQPKQEWSEEDENRFRNLIYLIEHSNESKGTKEGFVKFINRLKSIISSPKKDVMSEDEFEHIVGYLVQDIVANEHIPEGEKQSTKFFVEKYYNKLKPQNTWKPSDAQMASIACTVRKMKESACYDSEFVSLFNDLKKLRR